jgi:hypothetical protein
MGDQSNRMLHNLGAGIIDCSMGDYYNHPVVLVLGAICHLSDFTVLIK